AAGALLQGANQFITPNNVIQSVATLVTGKKVTVGYNEIRTQDVATNNVGFSGTASGTVAIVSGSATVGAGWSFGVTRTLMDLIDVNGDGLPDEVLKIPGETAADGSGAGILHVFLNLGDHFDSKETHWHVPSWQDTAEGSPAFADTQAGFGFIGSADDGLDFRRSKSFETNFDASVCILFVCVDVNGFQESGTSSASVAFEDVDGDGRPDMVFKSAGSQNVFVKLNQTPANMNLLTSVQRPLGGSFTIAYDRAGNYVRPDLSPVVDEPTNKFVMTTLSVNDGQGNTLRKKFAYDPSGFYSRVEREDYNFAKVTTTRAEGDWLAYSVQEVDYNNQDFYRKGLPARVVTTDANGLAFVAQTHEYADPENASPPADLYGSFFPAEQVRTTEYFEGTTTDVTKPVVQSQMTFSYDSSGNVTQVQDQPDVPSINYVYYNIVYDTCLSGVSCARSTPIFKPASIYATDRAGNTLRERHATYDPTTAAMTTYSQVIIGGVDPATGVANTTSSPDVATWQLTYDARGNVAQVTDPRGYQQSYTYDSTSQTYPVQVEDSFGYVSSSIPDLRFGKVASETDANGNMALFNYDDFGRLTSVDGPDDIGTAEHTLAFTYSEGSGSPATPAYATTAHKDRQHPGQPIMTATFADGLGRIIQTKKSLARDIGGSGVTNGMAVSGALVFDGFGRIAQQGQPFFDTSPPTTFVPSTPTNPTNYSYDVMDRVTSTLLSDPPPGISQLTYTTYGFDKLGSQTYLSTTFTDANVNGSYNGIGFGGYAREEIHDTRGDVLEVEQLNRLGSLDTTPTVLTTYYGYDPLQQLVSVTDAKGNLTHAVYDTAGRMVTLTSPDMGRTDFLYDLSGNLAEKQTAKLAANAQVIRYQYDFNRLREIDYPSSPPVQYTYGYPTEAGPLGLNRAGRLKTETGGWGNKGYEYDALGNVNSETWSVLKVGGDPTDAADYVYETIGFQYDSFGRLLQMVYPGPAAE
ncbi:MAG: hypothetical protein FWD17_17840, partial [Polyangiaceae bacterium]|nr:hypothetical protein [Polyangiaceae bacterium]